MLSTRESDEHKNEAIGVQKLALALMPVGATLTMAVPAAVSPPRQPGPCDIYDAAGTPCVSAHTATRALFETTVAAFDAGQTITIDAGVNLETAVIAMVGTAGATTAGAAIDLGATVIAVANTTGFSAGQTITVDSGPKQETAAAGVTITAALSRAHAGGIQVASSVPTPGAPNKYYPRR